MCIRKYTASRSLPNIRRETSGGNATIREQVSIQLNMLSLHRKARSFTLVLPEELLERLTLPHIP